MTGFFLHQDKAKHSLLYYVWFMISAVHSLSAYGVVLGSARTGLIFTGLQEGAQPGGGG